MTDKLQSLGGKTKKNYQSISNYSDELIYRRPSGLFQFEEDSLLKAGQKNAENMHEVLLSQRFLQNKPQVENRNIIFYDL